MVEGSLGVGDISGMLLEHPRFKERSSNPADPVLGLSKLSASSIQTVLAFGVGPNAHGVMRFAPSGYQINARTIWHEFLFKWWRLDPRRDWVRFILGTASTPGAYFTQAPNRSSFDRLPDLKEPESSKAWEVAKILISAGANLGGRVCLTEWYCSELYTPEQSVEDYETWCWVYSMHTLDVCWKLDVAEVLRVLVPETALDELRQLLVEASPEYLGIDEIL